jgi:hypothetical protein
MFVVTRCLQKRLDLVQDVIQRVIYFDTVVPQRPVPPASRVALERQTLRHYKGKNQALELRVQRPDPVACHHLSYIK